MREKNTIEKYLRCYSEEVTRGDFSFLPTYQSAVVVPAYDEEPGFLNSLLSEVRDGPRRLVVVVVNHPDSASEIRRRSSAELLQDFRRHRCGGLIGENVTFHPHFRSEHDKLDLIVVDATSGQLRLRSKDGVGRARKIGADLCVALYARGKIFSRFLGSTDADATLPFSYFDVLESDFPDATGLVFPYEHTPSGDPDLDMAMQWVEAGFRYYVLGLAWAGSPYAYPSLGSALAMSLPHYAQVRGVPNRQAGEDYYLVSKLSKLGPLHCALSPPIRLLTRRSERVPFGTGPSSRRAEQVLASGREVESYDPAVFETLRLFLNRMETEALAFPRQTSVENCPDWIRKRIATTREKLRKGWGSCPTPSHRLRRFHERFDALATLQFIHEAERQGIPRVGFEEALRRFPGATMTVEKNAASALLVAERALRRDVGIGRKIMKRWPEETFDWG